MSKQILHVMMVEKFIPSFIDIIDNHFSRARHKMVIINLSNIEVPHQFKEQDDLIWITKKYQLLKLSYLLNTSNKIILHSLFYRSLIVLLFFQPWLIKKCYWVMWGGDFYFPEIQSWLKKQVIKRIRHFVTYLEGDFELVKKWYKAKGERHDCFMYPSNLFKAVPKLDKGNSDSTINIMIGNSADPSNNHIEILEKVSKFKDKDIFIYAPLSYGDDTYAKLVAEKGKEMFGDKFIPLTEFMDTDKYIQFLNDIDIAIFAHKRQQAMGNTISLLGMGKKVYMRNDITPWTLFGEIGVKVFDFNSIDLASIKSEVMNENIKIIKSYFSKENYLNQLVKIFD